LKGRQLRLIAQDSTDVPAYSRKDIYARWGVRTTPKKRQRSKEKVEYFFGYKLYEGAKKMFTFGFEVKYLADSASDSSKVKQTLRYDNVIPLHGIKDYFANQKNLETKIARRAGR